MRSATNTFAVAPTRRNPTPLAPKPYRQNVTRFNRPCLGINGARCPALTRNRGGRCDTCRREWERLRGTSTQRGYGPEHRALRAHWAPIVATGTVVCRRPGCGQLIQPDEPWDLGHTESRTPNEPSAPEHRDCNRGHRPRVSTTSLSSSGPKLVVDTTAHQPTTHTGTNDVVADCPF